MTGPAAIDTPDDWGGAPIPKGDERVCLTAKAKRLLETLTLPEVVSLTQCLNSARCQSPLTDGEVEAIVHGLARRKPRFRVWTLEELDAQPDQEWLVEDMLPTDCIGAVYGGTGSGKTFVALDVAMTMASGGGDFLGHRVTGGPVCYVSLEGRLKERVRAWRHEHPDAVPRLVSVPDAFQLMSPVDVQDLIADIEHVAGNSLTLLVLDTWRRATPGGDENDSGDFSKAHDQLNLIRCHFGCSVLVVHHVGGNPEKRETPRGSSAFLAAMDFAWLVIRKGQARKIRCTKMRDSEEFPAFGFRLRAVAPSCVVDPGDVFDDEPLDANEEKALAVLAGRSEPVSATYWQGASHIAERTFFRTIEKLEERGLIERQGGGYVLPTAAKALP